ncbi:MAG: hypothetical protein RL385_1682 [Pseudomonadota bacterium]|jgi:hypothetical protein
MDLRRALSGTTDPASAEAREARFLCMVVENLTARQVGAQWAKSITRCDDPRCQGLLALRRIGDACEWYCRRCGASGAVVGFRDGPHDFTRHAQQLTAEAAEHTLYARLDEIDAARRQILPTPLRALLVLATSLAQDHVTLRCEEGDLGHLLEALQIALPKAHEDDLLPVQRLLARIDSALLSMRTREREAYTLH